MWIVRVALNRPYTFVVMALAILLGGIFTIARTPKDILPEIDIPVIAVVWSYSGLPPEEMEKRIVSGFERFLITTVNDVEHTESQSLTGVAVIKVFFHPGAKIEAATAQITAVAQTAVRGLPPGATPPLILRYSASNAPVLQLALESERLSEQQLFDYGVNFVRAGVVTVQGAGVPYPYGGKLRQAMIDIDLPRLYAWGLSPRDVINAVNAQNLTLPSGTVKLGAVEYPVRLNGSPETLQALNRIPIRTVQGRTVYVEDVANVRDGFAPQTSIVHANGKRAVVMPILKSAGASTLDVVSRVRQALPGILATLPPELKVTPLFDQSVFVRAAIRGLVHEALIAAALTALMMLLFLGSWRSTLIVTLSIPLSILVSIIGLRLTGQTLNVMTLGGLSLAVGILVDDATVELENVHRHLASGRPLLDSILTGAREIALPALVSTLCICIVFLPVAFISGAARSLFVPLAMSVVFAMLTSYLLSRTLVPTLLSYLLASEPHAPGPVSRWQRAVSAVDVGFSRLQASYSRILRQLLARPRATLLTFAAFASISLCLTCLIGRDFFPSVDAGLLRLHVKVAPGTRIEETERQYAGVERTIRRIVPKHDIENIINNIGLTVSPINLSMSDGSLISSADGEILLSLRPGHRPTREYERELRLALGREHPEKSFFFAAADLSTQVLNFGISAPIDVQIVGPASNQAKNLSIALSLLRKVRAIPGVVDARLQQVPDAPELRVDVNRDLTNQLGITQRDVANDVLVSLSSSGQTAPSYWLDPQKGIQYAVAVQTPQYELASLADLESTPVKAGDGDTQLLGNLAQISRRTSATNITHLNAMPTYDVLANVASTDLGSVADELRALVAQQTPQLPRGSTLKLKGQIESMDSSFEGLAYGLLFAIVLVYLLMVVNFQSWVDPLIILTALPGAVSGIVWMLFLTGTTLSVPALMGTIMCVGVATSNGVLVVAFANDLRKEAVKEGRDLDAAAAALVAGSTRLRPVLMTALAMMVGMLPAALALGEGAEQNAPLGRAVIGGLLVATLATLLVIPVSYSLLRRQQPTTLKEIAS
ncbi:MAG TPA: efflux RND transporter permease subunit [Polyangiaceae bacterium]|nr:efflux RND transporter permease subunit [Polyangiaceae bacterium]